MTTAALQLEYPLSEWVIAPSAEERARGQFSPERLREAHAAFRQHGCLLLRGALPVSLIDDMRAEFDARYGVLGFSGMMEQSRRPPPNPVDPRGEARFEITMRMSGAFARPEGFANPLLRGILAPLLGGDMQLNSFSIVVSYPGAAMQQIHRDHGHLFASEPDIGPNLPVYAVNVGVPLIDVDLEIGPTGVWPTSHRWAPNVEADPAAVSVCPIKRGDCILIDYRTLHTGMPNRSAQVRPILYMVYARGWFSDEATHFGVNSPDMPLEEYDKIPEAARKPLLYRALSQAVRSPRGAPEREARAPRAGLNPADPASWGKVGRNDACPCGSGKKYKQCHGRSA
ncbi:MAG TPA: phytanoyl-CoA dioxygenase family protein [Xanthobacteraceae bacterium]|nr:phytanoyl-CoA dioxygenase family protein [Xanthobacteraceae bacterium]